jgi:hypothetical protein
MKTIAIILIGIITILAFIYGPGALKIYRIMHLYDEDKISHNFINMRDLFTTSESIARSTKAKAIPKSNELFSLPESYKFDGEDQNLESALKHFKTDGLLIIKNNKVIYEDYFNGNTATFKTYIVVCR